MRRCGECQAFKQEEDSNTEGICRIHSKATFTYNTYGDLCPLYRKKPVSKVKPRRICPFCELRKPLYDDYGSYTLAFTKLTPMPSINLTTGEIGKAKSEPEFSMFLYEDADCAEAERAAFPIKFCPVCGRKLEEKA